MESKPSAFIDTLGIYCGDSFEQLAKFPPDCVDPSYISPLPPRGVQA